MTRREAANVIFDYIKDSGFIPANIQYGDGYFIFDMGEDGVVHFRIKGLHDWKFAMWIETDPEKLNGEKKEYPCVQFFCQHTLNIDKFKPSRSHFCIDYLLNDIQTDSWRLYEIADLLRMIKRHPLVAFTMDACGSQYYNKSYLMCYIKAKLYNCKDKSRRWLREFWTRVWHGSKVWFVNRYKVVDKAEFIDKNDENWVVYPRYDMCIHFKKISDDEDIQQKAELRILNFWFRRNYYSCMHLYLSRDGVDGTYSYTKHK